MHSLSFSQNLDGSVRLNTSTVDRRRIKYHSTRISIASSSDSSSRIVPIDLALQRIRSAKNELRYKKGGDISRMPLTASFVEDSRDAQSNFANGSVRFPTGPAEVSGYDSYDSESVQSSKSNSSAQSRVSIQRLGSGVASKFEFLPSDDDEITASPVRILPSDESFKWAKDDYNIAQRTIDVWTFVLTLRARVYFLDAKWSYLGGFTAEKQSLRRRSLARWVRESILELGPTFIKLGQLSSTRSDLLPLEIVEELSKLQDRVPAFSADKAIATIERELGQPVQILFKRFEDRPIAAASLGQVHRAWLHNGESVVVKVQRPGLKALFDIDLGNMKIIAEYFQSSESLGGPSRDWVGIYEECSKILYEEIDYINEGRNADRFRMDFRKYPWVKVPRVYWDYVSKKVLTLEYCPGTKISDVAKLDSFNLDKSLIARRAIEAYLIQILRTGFFHADPHPGNLAVETSSGALIYYDFGMMGDIKAFARERLLEMFYAVYEKDAKKVIASLIELGALVPTGDLTSVRRSIQFFLDNLGAPRQDEQSTIAAIGEDLFSIAVDQPFRFPSTFTFVLRAFSTLEGVGYTLDPNFKFADVAAPYAQELLGIRDGNSSQDYVIQQLQKQATEVRDATVSMPSRIQRMDEIITQLENGDIKLRVRVLEAERASRKAGILQVATMNMIFSATLLNAGLTLSSQGTVSVAVCNAMFSLAGLFAMAVLWGMNRVKRLERFEKML